MTAIEAAPVPPAPAVAPPLRARRLLYLATGGIQTMFLPMWLTWLRSSYPAAQIRYAMTYSAQRFVGTSAVAAAGGNGLPLMDIWPDEPDGALHTELAAWPDAVLVHPATMHFVSRFALGLGDTPILLALQCTTAPIVVCPSLPPGGHANPAYQRHIADLSVRDNVTVLPPITGVSMSSGQPGIGAPAALPQAVAALDDMLAWSEAL
jgi:phosphopantothenoylcysteine synthetase/decarboxylase